MPERWPRRLRTLVVIGAALGLVALLAGATRVAGAADLSLTLNYGVLAGLTGDSATSGQLWNESTRIAIAYVNKTLGQLSLADRIRVVLVDSQDSQGKPPEGIEAARKLVDIDKVHVVTPRGRAGTAAFDVYQVQPDATSRVVKTIFFNAGR